MEKLAFFSDRLMSKVEVAANGCWEWQGYVNPAGYGTVKTPWRPAPMLAHRAAYLLFVGEVPDGLQLDHLCRNTRCCNPEHLEPVTGKENRRRAAALVTECPSGHPYSAENTRVQVTAEGWEMRQCKTCNRDANRRRYHERKAVA